MNHNTFWIRAGALLRTTHRVVGVEPRRVFIVRFEHEHGWAEYNGESWQSQLCESRPIR